MRDDIERGDDNGNDRNDNDDDEGCNDEDTHGNDEDDKKMMTIRT